MAEAAQLAGAPREDLARGGQRRCSEGSRLFSIQYSVFSIQYSGDTHFSIQGIRTVFSIQYAGDTFIQYSGDADYEDLARGGQRRCTERHGLYRGNGLFRGKALFFQQWPGWDETSVREARGEGHDFHELQRLYLRRIFGF